MIPAALVAPGAPSPMDEALRLSSIAEVVWIQADRLPDKIALVHGERALTYRSLQERCARFAAFVAARAGRGARVGILLPNLPELAVAYFGAIAAGAIAVPINVRLSPAELEYVLSDSGAAVLVTTRAQRERLAPLPGARGVRTWVLVDGATGDDVPFAAALESAPQPAPAPVARGEVACLLYTSGTTGFPKGAMISHGNALFNVASCRRTLGYREDDVGLLTLPLFHVTGLHSQLLALLAAGAQVVLQQEYETGPMLALMERHRVTALFLVPAIYKLIALREDLPRHDLSCVRLAAYGGAPMDPETIGTLRRLLPGVELHNCYGLTECSSLGTVLPAEAVLTRVSSVGLPVPETEAEVRDEEGRPLPRGTAGELHLRGPHVVQGYWGAPEKTAAAIRDGWLRTGDVARIDEDGFVHVLDRTKDMINRGGEKIYGLEVEHAIAACPGVMDAAVFGVPHPVFGEVPAACVVPLPGARVAPDEVIAHCRARLADFKVPVAVRVVAQIPRNAGGKILKKQLQAEWTARSPEEGRT